MAQETNPYRDADIDFDERITEAKLVATTFLQLGGSGGEVEALLALYQALEKVQRNQKIVSEEQAKKEAAAQAHLSAHISQTNEAIKQAEEGFAEKEVGIEALRKEYVTFKANTEILFEGLAQTKAALETNLAQAHESGNTDLVASLQTNLANLNKQIVSAEDSARRQVAEFETQQEAQGVAFEVARKEWAGQYQKLKEEQAALERAFQDLQKEYQYIAAKLKSELEHLTANMLKMTANISANIEYGGFTDPQRFILQMQGKDSHLGSTVTVSRNPMWDLSDWQRILSSQGSFLEMAQEFAKNNGWEIPTPGRPNRHEYYLGTPERPWDGVYTINGVAQVSDPNKKRLINDCDLGLDFILAVRPVSFKFRVGSDDGRHYGFLGDQVRTALKGRAFAGVSESKEGIGMIYTELLAPLVKAVQEQQGQIETLKAEIRLLRQTR